MKSKNHMSQRNHNQSRKRRNLEGHLNYGLEDKEMIKKRNIIKNL